MQSPGEIAGWRGRARTEIQLERFEDAAADQARVRALGGDSDADRRIEIELALHAGRNAAAIEAIDRLLGRSPGDVRLLSLRGLAKFRAGDFAGCSADYAPRLASDPAFASRTPAHCAFAAGSYARAYDLYRRAFLRGEDATDRAYSALGALLSAERLPEPPADLAKLKAADETRWPGAMAGLLAGRRTVSEARNAAERWDNDPTVEEDDRVALIEFRYYLGAHLLARGDRTQARQQLEPVAYPMFRLQAEHMLALSQLATLRE